MDLNRMKKLAGLLKENVEGEEEVREEGTALNENEQNFLLDKLMEDKSKYNALMKKYNALRTAKTVSMSIKSNVQFDWNFENSVASYDTGNVSIEDIFERSPEFKKAMKDFTIGIKQHMKDAQIWIKETAKKHNISVDRQQSELLWADLFIYQDFN